jgi:hypothetical protein
MTAYPQRLAGLLDHIKHLEVVAIQQQRRPTLRLPRRPQTANDARNEPIDTEGRPM